MGNYLRYTLLNVDQKKKMFATKKMSKFFFIKNAKNSNFLH